jgi:proteic killer suppression protein
LKAGAVIQSWKSDVAKTIFEGADPGKGFPARLVKAARHRLAALNAAVTVGDLRTPPGNRLHELRGKRDGEWSISVNDQFRVTFLWGEAGPEEVWIGDYH